MHCDKEVRIVNYIPADMGETKYAEIRSACLSSSVFHAIKAHAML